MKKQILRIMTITLLCAGAFGTTKAMIVGTTNLTDSEKYPEKSILGRDKNSIKDLSDQMESIKKHYCNPSFISKIALPTITVASFGYFAKQLFNEKISKKKLFFSALATAISGIAWLYKPKYQKYKLDQTVKNLTNAVGTEADWAENWEKKSKSESKSYLQLPDFLDNKYKSLIYKETNSLNRIKNDMNNNIIENKTYNTTKHIFELTYARNQLNDFIEKAKKIPFEGDGSESEDSDSEEEEEDSDSEGSDPENEETPDTDFLINSNFVAHPF